jgi:excisionase family DNA binding protein
MVSSGHRASAPQVTGSEPLIDTREAAKLLSMSVAAVRAAAYRGTLRSHHVGRLLRFRPSELLPERG